MLWQVRDDILCIESTFALKQLIPQVKLLIVLYAVVEVDKYLLSINEVPYFSGYIKDSDSQNSTRPHLLPTYSPDRRL